MILIGYRRCSTCRAALNLLKKKKWTFTFRDIKTETPTAAEIASWHRNSGKELSAFFNTSGLAYRTENLSERRKRMTPEEQYELLASDGMLIRRPILLTDEGKLYIGREVLEYLAEKKGQESSEKQSE